MDNSPTTRTSGQQGSHHKPMRGQALVEYVLIVVLVVLAIAAILAATGPAIGNVFSNVVYNVLNTTGTPYSTLDSTQFWNYVTAVASYTPVQATFATNTPGGPTATWTPSKTITPTGFVASDTPIPSPTSTVGPSQTPTDFSYVVNTATPFVDSITNNVSWQYDFKNALDGLAWTVDYFDKASPAAWFTAPAVQKLPSDTVSAVNFNYGFGVPKSGMDPLAYAIRASTSTASFEARPYQVQIVANGPANVFINNVLVVQISAADDGTTRTAVAQYNASAASNVPVRVEYLNTNGAGNVKLTINNLADQGTCGWKIQNAQFHSPSSAWTDSDNTNYFNDSACYLRLRGTLDISDPTMTSPQLVFWDRYDLNAVDTLQVGVHNFNSTSAWTWVTVPNHTGPATNLNWAREVFDLKSFGGQDFSGTAKLEVAFAIITDSANVADGWFIDDVEVSNYVVKNFTVPFTDDLESASSANNYIANCKWARTSDITSPAGATVWASNPTGTYSANDDCSLQLNGIVDLTAYTGTNINVPQLTFVTKYFLNVSNDMIGVEYKTYDPLAPFPPTTGWTAMTPVGSSNPYVALSTSSTTYNQVTVDLTAQRGTKFWLRFRLTADNTFQAQGWFIDDIQLHDRVTTTTNYPFIEPFNNDSPTLANWTRGGTWGFATTTPAGTGEPAPGINAFRSGPSALTDSPAGNYTTGGTSTAELTPSLDMQGSVNPVMTFWTYWSATGANLYAEVSTDNGLTWNWVWRNLSNPPVQKAWQRIRVDMSAYKNNTVVNGKPLRIRFRMDTTTATVDDGWYIDDLSIDEDTDTKTGTSSVTDLSAGALQDPMDNTTAANWYPGGAWAVSNEKSITTGGSSWSDSPSGNYYAPEDSYLEYVPSIKIPNSGAGSKPGLYFWTTYNMAASTSDALSVEVVDISTIPPYYNTAWTKLTMPAPANWDTSSTPTNLGWSRIALNLASYAGKSIRLRFHLHSTNSSPLADGMFIDDLSILDQSSIPSLGSTVSEDASSTAAFNTKWVHEGNWQIVDSSATNEYAPFNYLPSNFQPQTVGGTSNWMATYYHVVNNTTAVWGAGAPGTISVTMPTSTNGSTIVSPGPFATTQISYDFSTNPPYPAGTLGWDTTPATANTDYYLASYTRRFQVSATGSYQFKLSFTGGARLKINGTVQTPTNTVTPSSFNVSTAPRVAFYTATLNLGTNYDFEVDFYHTSTAQSGGAQIDFQMAQQGNVIHTSAAGQPYAASNLTSLILNGNATIPAGNRYLLTFSERWDFQTGDYGRVYYSLDSGFTWTLIPTLTVNGTGPTSGLPGDWFNASAQITSGGGNFSSNTNIMFKFELDSRANGTNASNNGWYIANIIMTPTTVSTNAPTASFANIVTTANTNGQTTPTVTDPGDSSWTFTIVTQPLRGSAAVVSGQLVYTPGSDFTGQDSFQYQVTDPGGLQLATPAVASVTVNPGWQTAYNIGDSSTLTIAETNPWTGAAMSNSWANRFTGHTEPAVTRVCPSGATLIPAAANVQQDEMIRCFRAASNVSITSSGLSNGVYSVFLFLMEPGTSPTSFDIKINGQRVVPNYTTGGQGSWNKLGPWTVIVDGSGVNTAITISASSGGTANFSGVEIWRGGDYTNWTSADIGSSTLVGNTTTSPGTGGAAGISELADANSNSITVSASGSDIWGTSDQFRYVYMAQSGNVDVIARITAWDGIGWAKAGLMIRNSTDPGAKHALVMLNQSDPTNYGIYFEVRASTNGSTADPGSSPLHAYPMPMWLKISKTANSISGYYSTDGATWNQLWTTQTVAFNAKYLIGLAVTSTNTGTVSTATFDNISVIQR